MEDVGGAVCDGGVVGYVEGVFVDADGGIDLEDGGFDFGELGGGAGNKNEGGDGGVGVLEGYGAADATAGAGNEDDLSVLLERRGLGCGNGGVDVVVEMVSAGEEGTGVGWVLAHCEWDRKESSVGLCLQDIRHP